MREFFLKTFIFVVLISALMVGCNRPPSVFPNGFSKHIELLERNNDSHCNLVPPFTDSLVFPSKYQGAGSARDELNKDSEARYRALTEQINHFSANVARLSNRLYRDKGSMDDYSCFLQTLSAWAEQDGLLGEANSTGKAIRKWNLALLSSNYLKLHSLHSKLDDERFRQQRRQITAWLSELADVVIVDYQDQPKEKINNHNYWAAWAVMVTSAFSGSDFHYDWAKNQYEFAVMQISDEGLWPNELKRASRAHQYHNFALAPVVAIASFLKHNGDLEGGLPPTVRLVARNVLMGIESQLLFVSLTGTNQASHLITEKGRLAWLPIYVSLTADPFAETLMEKYQPEGSSRLGGNTQALFLNAG